jgi:hypothetical protein
MALTTLDDTPFPLQRGSVSVYSPTQVKVSRLYRAHLDGVAIDLWVEALYAYDAPYDPTATTWTDAIANAYNAGGWALP